MTALHRLVRPSEQSVLLDETTSIPRAEFVPVAAGAHRLDLDSVPPLAAHRGRGPALTLRWNDTGRRPAEIDVVVHLHGYSRPWLNLTRDIEPYSGLDLGPVDGAAGWGRSRPTLTLLPRGHFTAVKQTHGPLYVYTFPALDGSDGRKDGLARLVQFSLERFAAAIAGRTPRIARLILTAHSGGGAPLLRMLRFHDPHEIHVFDALYWDPTSLADWARAHIARERAGSPGPDRWAPGAMRVFHGPGTRGYSRRLAQLIAPEIANTGMERRYRVEASPLGHWQIPRSYGWRVLADASADVPGVVRDVPPSLGPRSAVQRELENGRARRQTTARRPPPRRPRPVAPASANNYIALFNGVSKLVEHWRSPSRGALDLGLPARDLLPRHRDLLVKLRDALILRASSAQSGLTAWQLISPALEIELRRAGGAGAGRDVSFARPQLDYLKAQFVNGAYYAAKAAARVTTDLPSADIALVEPKLKRAEAEFQLASQLFDQTKALGSGLAADDPRLHTAIEIAQIVALPGTISEKLEYARRHGIAVSAADLLSKVLEGTKAFVSVSAEIGKRVYEARRAAAVAHGAADVARFEAVAKRFEQLGKAAERIGHVATALALIGDGIKFVSALVDGDYEEALSAGGEFLVDLAPALLPEGAAAPLAIAVVSVKAVIEATRLAADFIRWCKDETVRQAASAFVATCNDVATRRDGALDLAADCQLILYEQPAIAELAKQNAVREAQLVSQGLRKLYELTVSRDPRDIGGHADVVTALGEKAKRALGPLQPDDLLSVAQRAADVFAGANAMAYYVGAAYRN